jgi:hypothetical protein
MLLQVKRPVEEVKLLLGAMRDIARYLDGLDEWAALNARGKIQSAMRLSKSSTIRVCAED